MCWPGHCRSEMHVTRVGHEMAYCTGVLAILHSCQLTNPPNITSTVLVLVCSSLLCDPMLQLDSGIQALQTVLDATSSPYSFFSELC